jgi:hypothetical protein
MAEQRLISSMFSKFSREEQSASIAKDLQVLGESLRMERTEAHANPPKRPVGHPKKSKEPLQPVLQQVEDEEVENGAPKKKRRGPYTNWFTSTLWPPILAVVKMQKNLGDALDYLQNHFKMPGQAHGPYQGLTRGTLYNWFTPNGEMRDGVKRFVEVGTYFTKSLQHTPILEDYPHVTTEIVKDLQEHRNVGLLLSIFLVQPIISAVFEKRVPHLLQPTPGRTFKVSKAWTREFIERNLNWSYRAPTIVASKLPADYADQGKTMAHRVAYLMRLYNISKSLVVNFDQTGINLIPIGNSRTWKTRGTRHIHFIGIEDKRAISIVVSSSTTGIVLPMQIIFTIKTPQSLPPHNFGRILCSLTGSYLTYTNNHRSNMQSMKYFVYWVLESYRLAQIKLLKLSKTQRMVWLIDTRRFTLQGNLSNG